MKSGLFLFLGLVLSSSTNQLMADEVATNVTELLQEDFKNDTTWTKAVVCVVETKTGKIKANLGYERKGSTLVPYTDTYQQEQNEMETGSTYLALLTSGKVTPDQVFDTGYGVYEDIHGNEIKDYNWRRGGNLQICLERALQVRSQVAFAMAKDYVYGENTSEFDALINTFLAGDPNSSMGILTFYNAVANGGKMMKLVPDGEDETVLLEKMADSLYVAQLQTGLRYSVSQGLMHKAGRDYVNVSACGRTFILKENLRRMELWGYFPSEDPIYTIMVILEKEGLPASAGGMCGPIFAKTVDLLVDTYKLALGHPSTKN